MIEGTCSSTSDVNVTAREWFGAEEMHFSKAVKGDQNWTGFGLCVTVVGVWI